MLTYTDGAPRDIMLYFTHTHVHTFTDDAPGGMKYVVLMHTHIHTYTRTQMVRLEA